jgi:uncharacterized RDD family membrane protein YckC
MSTALAAPPIDATTEVVTPENIAVHYRVAGPVRRSLSFAIDLTLFCSIMGAVTVAILIFSVMLASWLGAAIWLIFIFFMYWFYFGAQEWWFRGRTFGKWLLGLRVITIEGQPINGLQAIMRALLRTPDFFLPVIDLVTMSLTDRFQRLGDIVCGTVVVFEERQWLFGVAKLDDPRAVQLASYLPPDFEVTKSLAKALSTYVERRRFFSPPRRREVARHLAEPLLKRFGLPADTSYDLLLCALYYRAFIADRGEDEKQVAAIAANNNPFIVAGPPVQWPAAPKPLPEPEIRFINPTPMTPDPEIRFINSSSKT